MSYVSALVSALIVFASQLEPSKVPAVKDEHTAIVYCINLAANNPEAYASNELGSCTKLLGYLDICSEYKELDSTLPLGCYKMLGITPQTNDDD